MFCNFQASDVLLSNSRRSKNLFNITHFNGGELVFELKVWVLIHVSFQGGKEPLYFVLISSNKRIETAQFVDFHLVVVVQLCCRNGGVCFGWKIVIVEKK